MPYTSLITRLLLEEQLFTCWDIHPKAAPLLALSTAPTHFKGWRKLVGFKKKAKRKLFIRTYFVFLELLNSVGMLQYLFLVCPAELDSYTRTALA